MEFTVENICGLLIRSKLLSPDEVRNMYQRWQSESKDVSSLVQFTKWLSSNQYVTEYQAGLVAKGHADDFFLGPYKILDRIGRGRMAGVYKAVHHLGQQVAIKVIPPSRAKDAHMLARFQREARLAIRLKHPNVVRAFQVSETNSHHYLVMEHLEGETLEEILQRRKQLPPNEAVRLIHQALLGLQHIHEQGLVHRDLKPANLMLVPAAAPGMVDNTLRGTVKILDIGLGRALFDENPSLNPGDGFENLQLTAEGVLLGTPDYLAPEQARDPRTSDIRADIYSLGCVLFHTLTGQPPFPDTSIISQMVRHATEAPPPLKNFNPAIPEGLQQIMNWMLAKDPAQRYPTPERAAQALQVFLVAGNEPARGIDAEPQMKKYLTWLETGHDAGDKPSGAPAAQLAGNIPLATPVAVPLATPAGPAGARPLAPAIAPMAIPLEKKPQEAPVLQQPSRRPHGKKHKRRSRIAPATSTPAAPVSTGELDVELLPTPALRVSTPQRAKSRLSRRDWLFMALGAAAVILAGAIGLLLAWIKQQG